MKSSYVFATINAVYMAIAGDCNCSEGSFYDLHYRFLRWSVLIRCNFMIYLRMQWW